MSRTLADIGPIRLQRRCRYELRQRFDRRLPPWISLAWARAHGHHPGWRTIHPPASGDGDLALPPAGSSLQVVSFSFLNQERHLSWPIHWNDPQWPRLWQFYLHYFDWAREWLKEAASTGHWPDQSAALELLLDSWITSNSPGRGDGWHSYTLSLRTRNWIALFRGCPSLATPERLQSLWQQLCWLQAHPEHCHGGNHWLENLTALAIGGLQFDGPKAIHMHRRAMRLLQRELRQQVLSDGGHEERSASYHLLILDRLAELAQTLQSITGDKPPWLMEAIEAMAYWAALVRLETGKAPRFNDSAADAAPTLDTVLAFSNLALAQRSPSAKHPLPQAVVTDLPDTGWTLLRPGHGWELLFKCGVPCPNHLPAHVHSDQLSFELSHHGRWLLSEAGTSIYGDGPKRAYERSGAAHNVLQLGLESTPGVIHWLEPVDVWGGFRAGRKAQPRDRTCGQTAKGICFAAGSHNGFDHIGASHHRRVTLSDPQHSRLNLEVLDMVSTRVPLHVRQWWHLGPKINRELLDQVVLDAPSLARCESRWHSTWFSAGFGERLPRESLCISGRLFAGKHQLRCSLPLIHLVR
ncbi:heparinase II/III family protein [Synechococcus sp. Minos11]|uniref:heparinase II/III family protein n=1 Tax=Synechococcus sp. Minos11 TaxID=221341 RepID=UPI0016467294|nr:heparinase II/III family protein [Synechococcus sp. Minos11]